MKKKILIPLLLLALLMGAGAWYAHPREFFHAFPGWAENVPVTESYAILFPSGDEEMETVVLEGDDLTGLYDLLQSTTYSRSPVDLMYLGQAADSHRIFLEPYYVHLFFRTEAGLFEASFYGDEIVFASRSGSSHTYVPKGGLVFQQQVVDHILQVRG